MLIDVVESNLLGGTTIAVHLSGGLDSATIACIAAQRLKQQGRRLLALCSVLPTDHVGPESDERHFIEAVLDQTISTPSGSRFPPTRTRSVRSPAGSNAWANRNIVPSATSKKCWALSDRSMAWISS